MKYEIKGDTLPVVICKLEDGETIVNEGGAMSWMSPNLTMETSSNGGFGKLFGRALSGESMFQNQYTAKGGPGMIAFASKFPGAIIPFEIEPGREMIIQKGAFLASEKGVEVAMHFRKKLSTGLFGGEGFIMQKAAGSGTMFCEFDGHIVEYDLKAGQQIIVDTGHLGAMDATCSMEIQAVPGMKNKLLGGEGLFNTVVSGPGRVYLQTMPICNVAGAITPYIPTSNG